MYKQIVIKKVTCGKLLYYKGHNGDKYGQKIGPCFMGYLYTGNEGGFTCGYPQLLSG